MKTIEFMRSTDPLFYYCNCTTFKWCPVDHSGTYVLASEAEYEVSNAKAEWLERCTRFRQQDASEAEAELNKIANVIGSPKDVHRLPEALKAVLSSYRSRFEKSQERERMLVKPLKTIAEQKLEHEMEEYLREGADYKYAYECIVLLARAALAAKEE